jgi:hypothetical protein
MGLSFDVVIKAQDTRQTKGEPYGSYGRFVFFKNFNLALKQERHGFLPIHYFEWLIRRVEHEGVCQNIFEGSTSLENENL